MCAKACTPCINALYFFSQSGKLKALNIAGYELQTHGSGVTNYLKEFTSKRNMLVSIKVFISRN